MAIDWQEIEKKAKSFQSLDVQKDPDDKRILSTVFSGLRIKLSDLVSSLPSNSDSLLAIWADTLVIDYPGFDARGVVIMARNLDSSLLKGAALPIQPPVNEQTGICQFLIQQTTGGTPFTLTTSTQPDGAALYTVPVGSDPLTVGYFTVKGDGSFESESTHMPAELQDLIGRPWALNSLKASFTAASILMNSSDPEDLAVAESMLNWVVSCVRALGEQGETIPGSFTELYGQSAALLVTLNVRPGARFVPVLAGDFYLRQADNLLDALQSYQGQINTVDIRGDIQKTLAEVGGTLGDIATVELNPLTVDIKNVESNINDLARGIAILQTQFDMQLSSANAKYDVMQFKISDAQITEYLVAAFKSAVNVVKAGVAAGQMAEGDMSKGGELAANVVGAATNAYDAITALTKQFPQDSMLLRAQQLIQVQRQLITSMRAAIIVRDQIQAEIKTELQQLPSELGAVSIDPSLAWDNYMIAAEEKLTNLQRMMRSDEGGGWGAAQAAATSYLASLKILAQYGKAINSKYVAYTEQVARAAVLKAQIAAAKEAGRYWFELRDSAQSDEEKLAALRGFLVSRMDAIVRSLYVAWRYYRNAFFYLYFTEPKVAFSLDMDVAQLKSAFAEISAWTQSLLGGDSRDRVQLPNDNVDIEFRFPVFRADDVPDIVGNHALLIPATNKQPASLELSIPIDTPQLQEQLPQGGSVAIWVKSAEFFIDGAEANSKGRIILDVSTSGAYDNGFGLRDSYSFVTKPMGSSYAYEPGSGKVPIKWEVNTDVYMTPSPFTQWRLAFDPKGGDPTAATQLHMKLNVAFQSKV